MKIDFFAETEPKTPEPSIFEKWLYDEPEPLWWDAVTTEYKALYNQFGPMILITHPIKNYFVD